MRNYIWIILFFLVLVTPFALRLAVGEDARSEARGRDALRLVVISPHVEGIRREFADAFSDWHRERFGQPVIVDYRIYGGGNDILRYFRSGRPMFERNKTYGIDVVWGGGSFLFDMQLKREDFLAPLSLPDELMWRTYPEAKLAGTKLYDDADEPTWYGAAISSFGINYNRDVLRYLQVPEPTRWRDLADARLGGWFIAADPTRSVSVRSSFWIIIERAMIDAASAGRSEDDGWADGMGAVRLICSNARYFNDAASSMPNIIASGDAAVAMVIDFYGRSQVDAVGDRLGYIEPIGETSVDSDPIGIARGAEHRELAERFVRFVLSEDGQRLWITKPGAPGGPRETALRRLPIMRDLYRDRSNFTDDVDPFSPGFAFETSSARRATFGIIGELLDVSCTSLLDELRETRQAIERSPRRDELRAKLARFPFDQKEALRRAAEFDNASPVEKIAIKRRWQDEFRNEYERLRMEASRAPRITGYQPVPESSARAGSP